MSSMRYYEIMVSLPPRKFFIGNEFVDSQHSNGQRITLLNPVDDSVVVDDLQLAGKEDVDRAVALANEAFRKGPWASFTGVQRAACLNKFADIVEKNVDHLAYCESLPTGRPIAGIIHMDLAHMAQVFRYYAGWADKIAGQSFSEDNGFAKIVRYEPLGVCASLASYNATFLYIGWKLAPALAAGNTVIFKPSEKSPLGILAMAPLFAEAGFPPGVVQFLTGARETGALLSSHQRIAKISFTGSIAAGRAVQEAATNSNLKKVTLELGGKSAAVVFDDVDFDLCVDWYAFLTFILVEQYLIWHLSVGGGFLANSGQICVAASRVLIQESIATRFIQAIKEVFERARDGMGSSPLELSTQHGPVVDKSQFDRIMGYIEKGKQSAELVTGGKRKGSKGCFIEPTLFVNPTSDSPIWKEEIFGPVLTVKTFKTEKEAIELANDTVYGLASCLYTSDLSRALRVSSALESGGVSVNSPYLPELNTPFGGSKQSGQGRELGSHGLYSYLEPKSVHIKRFVK
ncbi:aldehyde dehydrogenase [Verticillium dahliae VdLs.17]|uniref:aldehyde dehydrogenase (NAD(+)) n=1 Tax=Verticillium dahliae (strain VdLs.17 / ATCC MYA-4575 / FGSC 10137) TaxID=498257 RepID=G2XAP7_VERDV|nr:aldehyde dehydrogenase [Verticillium dahliae VdLs.17]EGY16163.1 aldehyde dehydrogenase [Verticillium dahliae VdLs.17]